MLGEVDLSGNSALQRFAALAAEEADRARGTPHSSIAAAAAAAAAVTIIPDIRSFPVTPEDTASLETQSQQHEERGLGKSQSRNEGAGTSGESHQEQKASGFSPSGSAIRPVIPPVAGSAVPAAASSSSAHQLHGVVTVPDIPLPLLRLIDAAAHEGHPKALTKLRRIAAGLDTLESFTKGRRGEKDGDADHKTEGENAKGEEVKGEESKGVGINGVKETKGEATKGDETKGGGAAGDKEGEPDEGREAESHTEESGTGEGTKGSEVREAAGEGNAAVTQAGEDSGTPGSLGKEETSRLIVETLLAIMGGRHEEEEIGQAGSGRGEGGSSGTSSSSVGGSMGGSMGGSGVQGWIKGGGPVIMLTPEAARLGAWLLPWLPCHEPAQTPNAETDPAAENAENAENAETVVKPETAENSETAAKAPIQSSSDGDDPATSAAESPSADSPAADPPSTDSPDPSAVPSVISTSPAKPATQPAPEPPPRAKPAAQPPQVSPRTRMARGIARVLLSCTRNRGLCASMGLIRALLAALRVILLGGVDTQGLPPAAATADALRLPGKTSSTSFKRNGSSAAAGNGSSLNVSADETGYESETVAVAAAAGGVTPLFGVVDEAAWDCSPLVTALECLAAHSLNVAELQDWRAMAGEEVRGPSHSFELDGRTSGLLGPGESKWPFSNGYAVATWLYVESFVDTSASAITAAAKAAAIAAAITAKGGKGSAQVTAAQIAAAVAAANSNILHLPRLYSFLTIENHGIEAYFHKDTLVVESNCPWTGVRNAVRFRHTFLPRRWYFLALEHIFKPSLMGKAESEIRLYVNGRLIESWPLDLPRISNPLGFLCIGTNPPSGLLVNSSQKQTGPAAQHQHRQQRLQCPLFAELGPVYIFKEPIGSERIARLAVRGGDHLPVFGAGAGAPAHMGSEVMMRRAEESCSLDVDLASSIHLLYHPKMLLGRFCPDASPATASGVQRRPAEVVGQVHVAARRRAADALWAAAEGGPLALLPLCIEAVDLHSMAPQVRSPPLSLSASQLLPNVLRIIARSLRRPMNREELKGPAPALLSHLLRSVLSSPPTLTESACNESAAGDRSRSVESSKDKGQSRPPGEQKEGSRDRDKELVHACMLLAHVPRPGDHLKNHLMEHLLLHLPLWAPTHLSAQRALLAAIGDAVSLELQALQSVGAVSTKAGEAKGRMVKAGEAAGGVGALVTGGTGEARGAGGGEWGREEMQEERMGMMGEVNGMVNAVMGALEKLVCAGVGLDVMGADMRALVSFALQCPQANQKLVCAGVGLDVMGADMRALVSFALQCPQANQKLVCAGVGLDVMGADMRALVSFALQCPQANQKLVCAGVGLDVMGADMRALVSFALQCPQANQKLVCAGVGLDVMGADMRALVSFALQCPQANQVRNLNPKTPTLEPCAGEAGVCWRGARRDGGQHARSCLLRTAMLSSQPGGASAAATLPTHVSAQQQQGIGLHGAVPRIRRGRDAAGATAAAAGTHPFPRLLFPPLPFLPGGTGAPSALPPHVSAQQHQGIGLPGGPSAAAALPPHVSAQQQQGIGLHGAVPRIRRSRDAAGAAAGAAGRDSTSSSSPSPSLLFQVARVLLLLYRLMSQPNSSRSSAFMVQFLASGGAEMLLALLLEQQAGTQPRPLLLLPLLPFQVARVLLLLYRLMSQPNSRRASAFMVQFLASGGAEMLLALLLEQQAGTETYPRLLLPLLSFQVARVLLLLYRLMSQPSSSRASAFMVQFLASGGAEMLLALLLRETQYGETYPVSFPPKSGIRPIRRRLVPVPGGEGIGIGDGEGRGEVEGGKGGELEGKSEGDEENARKVLVFGDGKGGAVEGQGGEESRGEDPKEEGEVAGSGGNEGEGRGEGEREGEQEKGEGSEKDLTKEAGVEQSGAGKEQQERGLEEGEEENGEEDTRRGLAEVAAVVQRLRAKQVYEDDAEESAVQVTKEGLPVLAPWVCVSVPRLARTGTASGSSSVKSASSHASPGGLLADSGFLRLSDPSVLGVVPTTQGLGAVVTERAGKDRSNVGAWAVYGVQRALQVAPRRLFTPAVYHAVMTAVLRCKHLQVAPRRLFTPAVYHAVMTAVLRCKVRCDWCDGAGLRDVWRKKGSNVGVWAVYGVQRALQLAPKRLLTPAVYHAVMTAVLRCKRAGKDRSNVGAWAVYGVQRALQVAPRRLFTPAVYHAVMTVVLRCKLTDPFHNASPFYNPRMQAIGHRFSFCHPPPVHLHSALGAAAAASSPPLPALCLLLPFPFVPLSTPRQTIDSPSAILPPSTFIAPWEQQLLLALLRALPSAAPHTQLAVLQDLLLLLLLSLNPANTRLLTHSPEWPEWLLEILLSNLEVWNRAQQQPVPKRRFGNFHSLLHKFLADLLSLQTLSRRHPSSQHELMEALPSTGSLQTTATQINEESAAGGSGGDPRAVRSSTSVQEDVNELIFSFLGIVFEHCLTVKQGWKVLEATFHCLQWKALIGGSSVGEQLKRRQAAMGMLLEKEGVGAAESGVLAVLGGVGAGMSDALKGVLEDDQSLVTILRVVLVAARETDGGEMAGELIRKGVREGEEVTEKVLSSLLWRVWCERLLSRCERVLCERYCVKEYCVKEYGVKEYCVKEYGVKEYCVKEYCVKEYCVKEYCVKEYCVKEY
ncbi:unnamed protein product [Closterium sp. Yama58-4]|nr:unnamed protein product [Closterium sp. Yama58-4]